MISLYMISSVLSYSVLQLNTHLHTEQVCLQVCWNPAHRPVWGGSVVYTSRCIGDQGLGIMLHPYSALSFFRSLIHVVGPCFSFFVLMLIV